MVEEGVSYVSLGVKVRELTFLLEIRLFIFNFRGGRVEYIWVIFDIERIIFIFLKYICVGKLIVWR